MIDNQRCISNNQQVKTNKLTNIVSNTTLNDRSMMHHLISDRKYIFKVHSNIFSVAYHHPGHDHHDHYHHHDHHHHHDVVAI